MQKAVDESTTNRRKFLTTMAAAISAAALATGTAVTLAAAAEADPIFAAIAAYKYRRRAIDIALERFGAGLAGHVPVQAALQAEFVASKALIATSPTSRAGLLALDDHLRDNSGLALYIERRITTESGGFTMGGGPGAAEWLIAKRAAEIDAA
jgi:hypothetical protein